MKWHPCCFRIFRSKARNIRAPDGRTSNGCLPAGVVNDGPLARGAFYRPALLEINDHSPAIAQTEVFGPILVAHAFDSEDECKASLITSSAAMHRCGYAGGKQKGAQLS
ncbi:aldehyde dehydrogenase family protein [Paraburkholderia youngii]|uniref:aldehyde dehydrogenase family protein n=1 Tax=Paraburkholderia youngii TaxID=2782701 RepID=UPI003D1B18AF